MRKSKELISIEKMYLLKKIYLKLPVLIFDITAIPIAWYLAYWLRYNMQPFPTHLNSTYSLISLSFLAIVQIGFYYYFKVYRGLWRFASLNDVIRILKAVFIASICIIPVYYLSSLLHHIPRSLLPLYDMILIILLCGARLISRIHWDSRSKKEFNAVFKKVLIIGAGRAGESLVRDLKRTHSYHPVGFVDDSMKKKGLEIHGAPVLGPIRDLVSIVSKNEVDLIFIAIPSANSATMRLIVRYCEACNIPFRTLPSIQQLISGRVQVNALRKVNIEDLLGRDQIELSWDKIAAEIHGKKILVTGGGGSIGSELCRQVMALKPKQLIIIDNNEYNLYKIDLELNEKFPGIPFSLSLTNVTDITGINHVFKTYKPDIVFHAAAYKHVPMLEEQVRIAVQNNILGTQTVAEASVNVAVKKFILISTDKAVNPTNIMGATKRVAEIYCQNLNSRTPINFITVRFGNVLGSVGSVVPLFQKQLEQGGPLTVTHPDIQRYFMTIPEASQLILQAMANGEGGEIFVLDMGEPIKISYLAEQIIRLSGKEPYKEIKIHFSGLRPGEKLYEELFHSSENLEQTQHEKLFKAQIRKIDWEMLTIILEDLNLACLNHDNVALVKLLKIIVPEYNQETIKENTYTPTRSKKALAIQA